MSGFTFAALVFTVALLATTLYFILGSLPLLVLAHDSPLDARFVRGFFNTYYLAALCTVSATALSYALAGRFNLAAAAGALAALAAIQRRRLIPRMDALRDQIQVSATGAIPAFRRIHVAAIVVSVAQLVFIVWSLISASLQARAGV